MVTSGLMLNWYKISRLLLKGSKQPKASYDHCCFVSVYFVRDKRQQSKLIKITLVDLFSTQKHKYKQQLRWELLTNHIWSTTIHRRTRCFFHKNFKRQREIYHDITVSSYKSPGIVPKRFTGKQRKLFSMVYVVKLVL